MLCQILTSSRYRVNKATGELNNRRVKLCRLNRVGTKGWIKFEFVKKLLDKFRILKIFVEELSFEIAEYIFLILKNFEVFQP